MISTNTALSARDVTLKAESHWTCDTGHRLDGVEALGLLGVVTDAVQVDQVE